MEDGLRKRSNGKRGKFMVLKELQGFCLGDTATLYWEKPKHLPEKCSYIIKQDGETIGTAAKTHYAIEHLTPEREYVFSVSLVTEAGEQLGETLPLSLTVPREKQKIDVTKAPYFASGDGRTLNTAALQQAFDDCGPEEMVYLPAGVYLTGALRMHSDMGLYLEEGAVLQGTDRVEDYLPRIWSRFEGIEQECYSSVLNLGELDHDGGYNCERVAIWGKGTIASGGRTLAERVIESERERLQSYLEELGDKIYECEKPETIPGRVRPRLINMSNARDVILSGVTFKNGASWNVHMIYCDRILTNDCEFYSEDVWNGDGWDPDSSTNCTIFGCTFYTGDDGIAIKSGKNPEGNIINRKTSHIRIFDCKSAFGHGITIGSEISGGIEDVAIWDCDMISSMCGIEIKGTKKRGGYVRNIQVYDCSAARIMFHSVGYNDDGIGAEAPPVFEDCCFENIKVTGEYLDHAGEWVLADAIELCGFDEPEYELKRVVFRDIYLQGNTKGRKQNLSLMYCQDVTFERIHCI